MDTPQQLQETLKALGFVPAEEPWFHWCQALGDQMQLPEIEVTLPPAPDPMVQIRASDLAAIMAGAPQVPLAELECIAGELAELDSPVLARLDAVEAEVQRLGGVLLPHEEPWRPAIVPSGVTAETLQDPVDIPLDEGGTVRVGAVTLPSGAIRHVLVVTGQPAAEQHLAVLTRRDCAAIAEALESAGALESIAEVAK